MLEKEKNFISAVIYVHNKEKSLELFIETIAQVLKDYFENSEIVIVDDASTDQSSQIVKNLKKELSGISMSMIHMSSFHGLENAMVAGVDLAIGDFVLEFDKPWLDFEPSLILEAYNKCLEGNDIVFVSPTKKSSFLANLFYKIFNRFSGKTALASDFFKIISRRGINRVYSLYKTIPYRKVVYLNCGLKSAYLNYDSESAVCENSKEVRKKNMQTGINSLMIFTDFAVKSCTVITSILMLLTILIGAYVLVDYFVFRSPISGWSSIMLFLSMGFFGIFLILSIMLKYISLVLDMNFKNRKYLIEDIEKL